MCLMSKRIKECRLNSHLTQEELADMLGLKKSAIAKYENGRVENIKRSTIEKMSTIFDVKPSYIMGWADVPNGSEVSEETAEENQTRKILAILEESEDLEKAKEKVKALLK